VARKRRGLRGGSAGNEQLTAIVATLLIVLLAVEGATLLRLGSLLTVHVFVGLLLIPVVLLKLASTGWRLLHYYRGREDYVRRGPPHVALRVLVAPIAVASTLLLFASGVLLLVRDQTGGVVLGLHQASFVVWLGAVGVHVVAHVVKLPRIVRARVPGSAARAGLVAGAVAAGVLLATVTLPAADRLQDHATAHVGLDAQ
jgi:hypothetical protein